MRPIPASTAVAPACTMVCPVPAMVLLDMAKALVTLTLRNGNDYAVKDIEITCAFSRRDGSHLTDRTRVIHDTVNMKSRRVFARMHVGFVNVNANGAKCSLVAASRV